MNISIFDTFEPVDLRRTRKRLRRLVRNAPKKTMAFARREAQAAVEASAGRIRAHPLMAAALLLGAGLAVGSIAGRASR
ncbi:MAG TPA: hypothetical protein VIO94_15130 [Phenylobacterium sp.]